MKKIRISNTYDNSGYGVAGTTLTSLLIEAGYDISTNVIYTPMSRRDFAKSQEMEQIHKRLSNTKTPINLAITVPFLCDHHFQKGTYCVLQMFWETDKLCQEWINMINDGYTSEVWVPCKTNYDALMKSGIKKPVHIVPQYTKTDLMSAEEARTILPIPGNDETYRFYSIFQWIKRKAPETLLQAYFSEFSKDDNVMLVLKTYGPSAFADKRWIKEAILSMKEKSGNPNPPPVFYLGDLLQPDQVNAIHPQCQCYVYCGRGEGWNLPLIDAMNYGKQVITNKTGGISDWMDDDSAYIIPHKMMPLDTAGQAWARFYQSDPPQNWGESSIMDVRKMMRKAFDERNQCESRINRYEDILKICNKESVLALIKERLETINVK